MCAVFIADFLLLLSSFMGKVYEVRARPNDHHRCDAHPNTSVIFWNSLAQERTAMAVKYNVYYTPDSIFCFFQLFVCNPYIRLWSIRDDYVAPLTSPSFLPPRPFILHAFFVYAVSAPFRIGNKRRSFIQLAAVLFTADRSFIWVNHLKWSEKRYAALVVRQRAQHENELLDDLCYDHFVRMVECVLASNCVMHAIWASIGERRITAWKTPKRHCDDNNNSNLTITNNNWTATMQQTSKEII